MLKKINLVEDSKTASKIPQELFIPTVEYNVDDTETSLTITYKLPALKELSEYVQAFDSNKSEKGYLTLVQTDKVSLAGLTFTVGGYCKPSEFLETVKQTVLAQQQKRNREIDSLRSAYNVELRIYGKCLREGKQEEASRHLNKADKLAEQLNALGVTDI